MFKNLLAIAVIMLVCPTLVVAQGLPPEQLNFLFGGALAEAGGGIATNTQTVDMSVASSGSIIVYWAGDQFSIFDVDFFSSDPSVAVITGGEVFNPGSVIGDRWDGVNFTVDSGGASGNIFGSAVTTAGINPAFAPFDPLFDSTTGPIGSSGSFLLARVAYEIVGVGTTDFRFGLEPPLLVSLPINPNPLLVDATLTVVPEPSSTFALILCSLGLTVGRRKV